MKTMKNLKDQLSSKVAQITVETITPGPAAPEAEGKAAVLEAPITATTNSSNPFICIEEAKAKFSLLQKFVSEAMVDGVDYGHIAGFSKPTLLKSGAEKLCLVYGFSKHLEVTNRLEDWEKGLFAYEVKVTLINKRTGLIEAEGIGSCNSREKKYAKQDAYTISNNILKMANKRAMVDGVLSATSSGLFTQDIEDLELPPPTPSKSVTGVTAVTITPVKVEPSVDNSQQPATKAQLQQIYTMAQDQNLPASVMRATILNLFGAEASTDLTAMQADALIDWLQRA